LAASLHSWPASRKIVEIALRTTSSSSITNIRMDSPRPRYNVAGNLTSRNDAFGLTRASPRGGSIDCLALRLYPCLRSSASAWQSRRRPLVRRRIADAGRSTRMVDAVGRRAKSAGSCSRVSNPFSQLVELPLLRKSSGARPGRLPKGASAMYPKADLTSQRRHFAFGPRPEDA
jgi:hypothetical protein